MDVPRIPHVEGEAFHLLLAQRPICVLLCPSGRPPRMLDMVASGCPVVVVRMPGEQFRRQDELSRVLIEVQAQGSDIARAIESLLVDRVRLASLMVHAAEYVRNLPAPGAAARGMIDDFRSIYGTGSENGFGVPAGSGNGASESPRRRRDPLRDIPALQTSKAKRPSQ